MERFAFTRKGAGRQPYDRDLEDPELLNRDVAVANFALRQRRYRLVMVAQVPIIPRAKVEDSCGRIK